MFTRKQDGTIVACSLLHVPVSDLNAADVFKVGSRWKDEKVLYNTVRTFTRMVAGTSGRLGGALEAVEITPFE